MPALRYSGTFPVSRLEVVDGPDAAQGPTAVDATLVAFSAFKAHDRAASARPAAAFALRVKNSAAAAAEVGFSFNMPFMIERDQLRAGTPLPLTEQPAAAAATSAEACAAQCNRAAACRSWVLRAGACTLQSDAPRNVYAAGVVSGLYGAWHPDPAGQCLTLSRPGR